MTEVDHLAVALRFAAVGAAVFPIDPQTKRPVAGLPWKDRSTTDAAAVRALWAASAGAGVAIDLAKSGLVAIDCDRHGGPDGVAAFRELAARHELIGPDVPIVKTAGGGEHLIFRNLADAPLTNARGALPPGIDVRGSGGYVVAAGTVRSDGSAWTRADGAVDLASALDFDAVPEIPGWIVEIIRNKAEQSEDGPRTSSRGSSEPRRDDAWLRAYVDAAVQSECDSVGSAPSGARNETLNRAAFVLGTFVGAGVLNGSTVAQQLYEAARLSGLTNDDGNRQVWATIQSGLTAGIRNPRDLSKIEQEPAFFRDQFGQADGSQAHEEPRKSEAPQREILFDPWQKFIVPDFPFDVLPGDIADFVETQAMAIGCDPSGIAMSVLATFSAALDHRFTLRLMRHGVFSASPRLWVLLVGDPSYKKTPMQNAALRPLETHQNRLRDDYERAVDEHLKAGGKPETGPPHPPRFIVGDTTIEKLGEIAARYDRGLLVRRDELAGWIGSMEKYGGAKGGAVDRAFWLQSFDGGSFTVDRISRGEFRVRNLSVSMLGGIQPARLAELHGLTSDGLLQRFMPVMLKAPSFREDVETDASSLVYAQRVLECVNARPEILRLNDDAVDAMRDLHRYLHDLEQTASGVTAGFQGFVGKLAGLSGSITILLHMIGDPKRAAYQEVTAATVEKAHTVVQDFVLPHAMEFYRTSEATTNGDRLQRIASYILTSGKKRIVASDFASNVATFKGQPLDEIIRQLSPLIATGWLAQEKPGPIANAWIVNPAVNAQFAERAKEEDARKAAMADLMQSPRRRRAA